MINYKNIIIGILLLLLLLTQTCKEIKTCPEYIDKVKSDTVIVTDTFYVLHMEEVNTKPKKIKTIPQSFPEWVDLDTPIINTCKDINIFQDSIKIDSIGSVNIVDTMQNNEIIGRKFTSNIKVPVITNTITIRDSIFIKEKKRTQWYVGVDISGNQFDPFTQIGTGFLIKNKKDGIFGAKVNLDIKGNLTYGVQKYWKIKIK